MSIVRRWRAFSMLPSVRPWTERRVYRKWVRDGRPIPAPPIVKQRIVKEALRQSGADTVVETGTFTGEMVHALIGRARRIVSIELDRAFYEQARRRFANVSSVELLHGDSGVVLPKVLQQITTPALFWLDGHYTGGVSARTDVASPIAQEIEALLDHPVGGHVVLIDDARLFTGEDGYYTVDTLRASIRERQPHAEFEVQDDIIRWVSRPVERSAQVNVGRL